MGSGQVGRSEFLSEEFDEINTSEGDGQWAGGPE